MESNKENTPRNKECRLEKLYGITRQEYEVRCKSQENKCMICNIETKLMIDHDEATAVIRGLLCRTCNLALGLFKHNSYFLRKAAIYLDAAPKKPDWKRQLMKL